MEVVFGRTSDPKKKEEEEIRRRGESKAHLIPRKKSGEMNGMMASY